MSFSTDDWEDDDLLEDESPPEPVSVYATLDEFVEEFFAKVCSYKLSPAPGRGLRWDPHWWRWPQVRIRLDYLWKTWEAATAADNAQATADWWLHIFDPTVRVLLDGENGPLNSYRDDMEEGWDDESYIPELPCAGHQPAMEEPLEL